MPVRCSCRRYLKEPMCVLPCGGCFGQGKARAGQHSQLQLHFAWRLVLVHGFLSSAAACWHVNALIIMQQPKALLCWLVIGCSVTAET